MNERVGLVCSERTLVTVGMLQGLNALYSLAVTELLGKEGNAHDPAERRGTWSRPRSI
jgi:hypothetical protein